MIVVFACEVVKLMIRSSSLGTSQAQANAKLSLVGRAPAILCQSCNLRG